MCNASLPTPLHFFRTPRGLCVLCARHAGAGCSAARGCRVCRGRASAFSWDDGMCAVCSILGERRGRERDRGRGELTDGMSDLSSRDHVHEAGAGPRQRSQLGSGAHSPALSLSLAVSFSPEREKELLFPRQHNTNGCGVHSPALSSNLTHPRMEFCLSVLSVSAFVPV